MTMAAACYPETQARVQAQLDEVVGSDRGTHFADTPCRTRAITYLVHVAPTFEDEEMLPEVTAFVLEVYRWRPVSAGGQLHECASGVIILIDCVSGVPHRSTKDIVWVSSRFDRFAWS